MFFTVKASSGLWLLTRCIIKAEEDRDLSFLIFGNDDVTITEIEYKLAPWGTTFQPGDPEALLDSLTSISVIFCTKACSDNTECRTFDYDTASKQCRLFQIPTTLQDLTPSVPTQRVGMIQITDQLFTAYGQPCTNCDRHRYLICSANNTCRCTKNLCWNQTQCQYYKGFNSSYSQVHLCIDAMRLSFSRILWSFDNNLMDLYSNFNGVPTSSVSYVTSYRGAGAALYLTRTSSQAVIIDSPQLPISATSFTLEAWIYPIISSTNDHAIFGQCQALADNMCLQLSILNYRLHLTFGNDTLVGMTMLTMNQWSHIACVFDFRSLTQNLYLNGILDGTRSADFFRGFAAITTIGVSYLTSPGTNFFNGYLDQMDFTLRAKNASEILTDATLVSYYSFDDLSLIDEGPLGINMTNSGTLINVPGRVNQAIQFSSNGYMTAPYAAYTRLGQNNYPYSFAMWIKLAGPYATSTLIFAQAYPWCLGMLIIDSNGVLRAYGYDGTTKTVDGPTIPLNQWTHLATTYNPTNGLRLYINGVQYSTSSPYSHTTHNIPLTLTFGSQHDINGCIPYYGGYFRDSIDELYIFSRQLTAAEVFSLANP